MSFALPVFAPEAVEMPSVPTYVSVPVRTAPMPDRYADKGFRPDVFGCGAFDAETVRRMAFLDNPKGKPGRVPTEDALFAAALTAGEAISRLFPSVSSVLYASARAFLPELAARSEITEADLARLLKPFAHAPSPAAALERFRAAERHAALHPLLAAAALCGNFYVRMGRDAQDFDPFAEDPETPCALLLGLLMAQRKGYFYAAYCAPEEVMALYPEVYARALGRSLLLKQPGIWIGFFLRCLERAAGGLPPEDRALARRRVDEDLPEARFSAEETRSLREDDEAPEDSAVGDALVVDDAQAEQADIESETEGLTLTFSAPLPGGLFSRSGFVSPDEEPETEVEAEANGANAVQMFVAQEDFLWDDEEARSHNLAEAEDTADEVIDTALKEILELALPEPPELARRVLGLFEGAPPGAGLTLADMVQLTGANRNTLKIRLRELVSAGRLVRYGKGRGTGYCVR